MLEGGPRREERKHDRKGAALLLEGRDRAGVDRFDKAIRGDIAANPHRVGRPR
jgi:hypothetical protein